MCIVTLTFFHVYLRHCLSTSPYIVANCCFNFSTSSVSYIPLNPHSLNIRWIPIQIKDNAHKGASFLREMMEPPFCRLYSRFPSVSRVANLISLRRQETKAFSSRSESFPLERSFFTGAEVYAFREAIGAAEAARCRQIFSKKIMPILEKHKLERCCGGRNRTYYGKLMGLVSIRSSSPRKIL